jgi:hypothetical protein
VKGVQWFTRDPLYGNDGPVLWGRERLEKTMDGNRKDEL